MEHKSESITLLLDTEFPAALHREMLLTSRVTASVLQLGVYCKSIFFPPLEDGTAVHIITNPPGKWPSMAEEVALTTQALRGAGAEVHYVRRHGLLHQKQVLCAPDIVFLGSHNMSRQSHTINLESSLMIRSATLYNTLLERMLSLSGDKQRLNSGPGCDDCGL